MSIIRPADDGGDPSNFGSMLYLVGKGDTGDDDEKLAVDSVESTSVGVAMDFPRVPQPHVVTGEDVGGSAQRNDFNVQGRTRMLTEILGRIKGTQPTGPKGGVHVVGFYRINGDGKTTACEVLCNELSVKYRGKVCHVDIGSAKEEEALRQLLKTLSKLEPERVKNLNLNDCCSYTSTRLTKDRVFVALDNMVENASNMLAKFLLRVNFGDGSVVFVTARSMEDLVRLGVEEQNCFIMPGLEVEEAKSLVLSSGHLKQNDVGEEIVRACMSKCHFSVASDLKYYHPLALKTSGMLLGNLIRGGKDKKAVLSRTTCTQDHLYSDGSFEFYFRNAIDMGNVVGVGLPFAKVILEDGCRIIVQELLEIEWFETFRRVQLISAFRCRSVLLERSQGKMGMNTNFEVYPILLTVAKYIILTEAITKFVTINDNEKSTSGGGSGSASDLGTMSTTLRTLLLCQPQNQEEKDKEGNADNGKGLPVSKELHDQTSLTRVSIQFLGGGEIIKELARTIRKGKEVDRLRQTRRPENLRPELKLLDKKIRPGLEILFLNQDNAKQLRCTIGSTSFQMDRDGVWLHDKWEVDFGLYGTFQQYASYDIHSFEALDVKDGLIRTNASVETGDSEGMTVETTSTLGAKVSVLNASLAVKSNNARNEHDTRQRSSSVELPISLTAGRLRYEKHEDDSQIGCRYFNIEGPYYYVDSCRQHASRIQQDVKFQATFTIQEDVLPLEFVEYKLIASRFLKEVQQEVAVSSYLEDAERYFGNGNQASTLEKDGKSSEKEKEISTSNVKAAAGDDHLEISYVQKSEKTILVNHSMSHLDSKRHNLKESRDGTFTKMNGKIPVPARLSCSSTYL